VKHTRIIPRLDIKSGYVIKGVHLEGLRRVGDPAELSLRYYQQGADELVYVDVVASLYGRNYAKEVIKKVSHEVFIPLTVAGGVKSLEDFSEILGSGADKVAANTGFLTNPDLVDIAAKKFGSQCVVGLIEAKSTPQGTWEALYENGRENSGRDAVEWAKELVERGAGELMVTSIDRDGTCQGYDIALTRAISTCVSVPVIASGGAGKASDVAEVLLEGRADAAAVAHLFHYEKTTPDEIKAALHEIIDGRGGA